MAKYKPTIGLEIHAELNTRTKMFCDSLNDPEEKKPNTNVCPVCLAHPGAMPTINKEAVEKVIKVGLALNGKVEPFAKFDRKNYFYPDLPKAYQISEYDAPLITGGELLGVRIHRIHLEEDAGKLIHAENGTSLVDFNRAGVPLMELVTEPDMHSVDEAVRFMKELQLILQYVGASEASMEKGQMRADVNISLSLDEEKLGSKVEVKNLNSFKSVAAAIEFEIKRQSELLEKGEKIPQETRGFVDAKAETTSQRSKEEAHDYRYFPEPDLPPMDTTMFAPEILKESLPELPQAKRERFMSEFELSAIQANLLIENKLMSDFFESAASELATKDELQTSALEKKPKQILFNYLSTELQGLINEKGISWPELKISPEHLAHLADFVSEGKLTTPQGKAVLRQMFGSGEDPENILKESKFERIDSSDLETIISEVIAENPKPIEDYKKGKTGSIQFLVGKVMQKTKGAADPGEIQAKLTEKLGK